MVVNLVSKGESFSQEIDYCHHAHSKFIWCKLFCSNLQTKPFFTGPGKCIFYDKPAGHLKIGVASVFQ